MAEREAHLEIGIEPTGAVEAAEKINAALMLVADSADKALAAIDKLGKIKPPSIPRGPTGAPSQPAGPRGASSTVATPNTSGASQRIKQLKADVESLNAKISKIASPQISVTGVNNQIRSVGRELDRIASKDLTRMGDGGAASIKKVQDRIAELNRQLEEVDKAGVRSSNLMGEDFVGPKTRKQARAEEASRISDQSRLSESSPGFIGPVSPKKYEADVAALRKAEKDKTDAVQQEEAKRQAILSQSSVRQLKGDYESLKSTLGNIKAPELNTRGLRQKIESVGRELDRLATKDFTRMGDGGEASIKKIQDRVAELTNQLAKIRDVKIKADTSQSKVQAIRADYGTLSPVPTDLKSPLIDATKINTEFKALGREIEKLSKTDLSRLTDGGEASVKALQSRIEQLKRQLSDVAKITGVAKVQAPVSAMDLTKVKADFENIKSSADQVREQLKNLKFPTSSFSSLRAEIKDVGRDIDKLSKADLTKIGDGGAEAVSRIQAKIASLNQQIASQNKSITDHVDARTGQQAGVSAASVKNLKTEYDRLKDSIGLIKFPNLKTDEIRNEIHSLGSELERISKTDFRKIADGGIASVKALEDRVAKLNSELSRALKQDERTRQSMMPSPSSASFVGPMPETRAQAEKRQEADKKATYDAGAAISKFAKNLSPNISVNAGPAIKQLEGLKNAFSKVGEAAMGMQGVIAGATVMVLGRDIARTGMAFENLQKGLEVATGSAGQAQVEMERLRREADRLGIDILHTGREYVNFTAAIQGSNVDIEKAKDAFFATAQAMSLLGRSPEGAARAFKALEQFASKGQIMTEELKGQLAEQLPGAFNITAKALGMTAEELGKAMEEGRISARAFFDVFGEAVNNKFPVNGKIESASASFARFNNALLDIKATIANGGFLKALADGANEMSKFMASDVGKKMASDLGGALKTAVDALISSFKFLTENIELTKAVVGGLVAIKVAGWAIDIAKAVGGLAVQFALLARFMVGHPLIGVVTAALAGATALYAWAKATNTAQKAQLAHNDALKELKELRSALKSTAADDKQEVQNIRDKITAIRDLAAEERKRLDDNIKRAKEIKEYEGAMFATGLGAEFGGMVESSANRQEDIERQERERAMARTREQAAQRALMQGQPGFTGGFTRGGTSAAAPGIVAQAQAETLAKATAEIEKQIAANEKLFQTFEMNAGAAAELKEQMELNAQLKRDFEGKVSPEGFKEIVALMDQLGESKDKVTAGPIIQDLNQGILDLYKLADAHKSGVDAANAERVAQEARNRIVQAGIGISSAAAQSIRELSQAQADAAFTAQMQEKQAEINRSMNAERAKTSVLINEKGPARVEGVAAVDALVGMGRDPGDKRPTVQNAEALDTAKLAGKAAADAETEALKRQTAVLKDELPLVEKIASLERGRSERKAKEAGELRALIELRKTYGNVDLKDLPAEAKGLVQAKGQEAALQFRIQQGNRIGGAPTDNRFGETLRELQQDIDAQQQLASAYGQGAEAVEAATRKQEILNKVQSLNEKLTAQQKAQLEGLIGTLYDVKNAAEFEGVKMDLKEQISQIQAMAAAEYQSAEAANVEAVAQEARRQALELGVLADRDAVRSLEELIAARQRAEQISDVNKGIVQNRETIRAYDEEREALKLVGEERIRRMAELQMEQDLRSKGTPMGTEGVPELIQTSGGAAMEEYRFNQEQSVESTKRQITAIGKQSEAMHLLGEEYVRRNAELQMEAQLLEETGSATGYLAEEQIRLAGELAVANDRMERQNDALRDLANSGLTFNESMRQISYDGLGSLEDALVDIITGTKSVKEAFADMAKSIAADLARMAVRQAITVPLAGFLSSMFMGPAAMAGGAAMATGAPINLAAPMIGGGIYHTGGIVGRDNAPSRSVSPAVFSGAPRFHTGKLPANANMPSKLPGLAGGEVAAILKKDEGVFTPQQMASLGPAGGNQTVVVSPTINVQQPPGATEQQGQAFGKGIVRQLEGMVDERIQRAFRPGGLRNQSGGAY